MPWFRKPAAVDVERFLDEQRAADFSYSEVGATAGTLPQGYTVDRTRVLLGQGEAVFQAARTGLQQWRQFDIGWLELWPPGQAIRAGKTIVFAGRAVGLWWLNACRIVHVIDESGPSQRFGFAYGTLPRHAGVGEERFVVEWERERDEVWYEILAFSRPHSIAARVGYPVFRTIQKRFGRDSAAAMKKIAKRG